MLWVVIAGGVGWGGVGGSGVGYVGVYRDRVEVSWVC